MRKIVCGIMMNNKIKIFKPLYTGIQILKDNGILKYTKYTRSFISYLR